MKVMIGVTAYNEEKNIGRLLDALVTNAPREVKAISVVSCSTDKTNDVVASYCQKDPRIRLFAERERKGKVSAFNILLAESEKYDIMVYMGGDDLPDRDAVRVLIDELRNGNVSMVGGRPIPVDDRKTLMGFCAHLLWELHHLISLKPSPKISGELMAFKTGILLELPPAVINDDVYAQFIFEIKGYKTAYCPEAKVFLKGPSTIRDFIKQRRRVFVGHRQMRFLLGKDIPTMKMPRWSQIADACPFTGIKGRVYAMVFILLQAIAVLLSKWDFYTHNLPYKWPIAETTKSLRYGV